MRQNSVRRRLAAVLAMAVAATGFAFAVAAPAGAAPRALAAPGDTGDDGEGGSKSLIEQLEDASKGYVEAKEALEKSKKRQAQLAALIKQIDGDLAPRQQALDEVAQQTYRNGRLGPMSALLTASSTGSMLDRVETLETVAVKQNQALKALKDARSKQERARAAVAAEIQDQQKQVTIMAKRKAQAEGALKAAGQGQDASGSGGGGSSSKASGFSGGSGCQTDPTGTGGCITPRMRHAYDEARQAGFTRYTKCFRHQNSGEHPKGRACDFSVEKGTFGGDATGADRTYGNRLADFFIGNSGGLGVLYVIWYRRIWLPSSGWKSYSGAGGDPSSDHSNHVHLSVRP
jgi:peptidoglycan DL-endopeptidase CwlO